ncbi:MAG TPA: hypothetical protein VFR75_09185 [Solirubrobacterales bacterium]|nr:hypothetical protein [Solirubrobacterales bacterium]
MSWLDLDMEIGQHLRDMDERMERGFTQLMGRLEAAERRWEEDERARRREWEELEGRAMTAMEGHRHHNDGLLRKMDVMTTVELNILREISEDMEKGRAEAREENRAHTEALMKMLDRLPPPEGKR